MAAKSPVLATTVVPLTPAQRTASSAPRSADGSSEGAIATGQRGDRASRYAALVDDHAAAILRYLCGLVDSVPAAEDLAQETYLQAWAHLDQLRDPASARSWLFAIASNAARRHLRRQARFGWLSLEWATGRAAREAGVEERADGDERAAGLERALGALGEADRQLVLLVGLEGFSIGEAAALVGVSPEAAKKRWQRACARVRAKVDGERAMGDGR